MKQRVKPVVQLTGSPGQKAQHACMTGSAGLRLFVYYGAYDLRQPAQLEALRAAYRSDFGEECPADGPGDAPIRYLVVVNNQPVLMPEAEAPGAIFFATLIAKGYEAAKKVLHRDDVLS
jgi:hypothetical protein